MGPKTATDLLLKFGTLDGVYEHLQDPSIRPKLREKLEADKEKAYLSYDLATIRTNAPIDFSPKNAITQPYNRLELFKLFTRLEFVRLIDRYGLRGAELEEAASESAEESPRETLPRVDTLPEPGTEGAVYLAPDRDAGHCLCGGGLHPDTSGNSPGGESSGGTKLGVP